MKYMLQTDSTKILGVLTSALDSTVGHIETELEPVEILTHYAFDGSGIIFVGPAPSGHHRWDFAVQAWVDPRALDDLKQEKREAIKQARDSEEFSGFAWGALRFDSDPISQQRIGLSCQKALYATSQGLAFLTDWTLQDNTVTSLTGRQMIEVALALGEHIGAVHAKSRALQAQIVAATSATQLDAIAW